MTEQTTPLPTPAQDAYEASKAYYEERKAAWIIATADALNAKMTAPEAIAEAKRLVKWGKPQTKKAAALRVIAMHRWDETETYKAHRALSLAASREGEILHSIAKAPEVVASARKDVLDKVTSEHAPYNTEYILDEVLGLQSAGIVASLWADVEFSIREHGLSPREALVAVREHNLKTLLTAVRYSRTSSSSTRNMTQTTNNAVTAKWLDDTERLTD